MIPTPSEIEQQVRTALAEDVGSGDITAQLIDKDTSAQARIITRESGAFCGRAWVDEVFRQLDSNTKVDWLVEDGDAVTPDQPLFALSGNARVLLTGERTALNFVQLLSGTATAAANLAAMVSHTSVKLLDTRKTIPGLRNAQKYAVTCGGCHNHRIGLYDAFLIKENHIAACGGIEAAVQTARELAPEITVEVEVENMNELAQALAAKADIIMLDNFSIQNMCAAVAMNEGHTKLEASGGINETTLVPIAETGVDYISIGDLTKNVRAMDLSMRFVNS